MLALFVVESRETKVKMGKNGEMKVKVKNEKCVKVKRKRKKIKIFIFTQKSLIKSN